MRLEHSDLSERILYAAQERGARGAPEKYLQAKLGVPVDRIRQNIPAEVQIMQSQPLLLLWKQSLDQQQTLLMETVSDFHERNPLLPGIPKQQLRSQAMPRAASDLFTLILNHALSNRRLQLQRDVVSLYGRAVQLSQPELSLASKVEDGVSRAALEFPGIEAVARTVGHKLEEVKQIFYVLVRERKIIKISDDYFVHADQLAQLKQKLREIKNSRKAFGVADFKDLFGVSRKYAIPLLEHLDREGVTRRVGNERIIL